jgi:cell division protease FtsH
MGVTRIGLRQAEAELTMPNGQISGPHDDDAVDQATALVNAGQPAAALPLYDDILIQRQDCAKAHCGRGSALRDLGRFDEALSSFASALAIEPNYARAIFNRGLTRFKQGDVATAFEDFDKAISIDPEVGFYFHRADCFARLEKYEEAADDLTACLDRDGNQARFWRHRGMAWIALKMPDAAIADIQKSIELDDQDVDSYRWLAHQLAQRRRYDEAVKWFDRAIAKWPSNGRLYFGRGCTLVYSGDVEAAIRDFTSSMANGHDNAECFQWRGHCWQRLDDVERAIADFDEALVRDENFVDAVLGRGRVRLDDDDFDNALVDLTRAIALSRDDPQPYEIRARVYIALEDDDRALSDLNHALQLDPNNAIALKARSQLHLSRGAIDLAEVDLDALACANEKTQKDYDMNQRQIRTSLLLAEHFGEIPTADLAITERQFPFRVRADLQRAVDEFVDSSINVAHFSGVKREHGYEGLSFSELLFPNPHYPALAVPAQYEEIDVGEDQPVRCLKNGLWLLERDGFKFAILFAAAKDHGRTVGMQFQVAAPHGENGDRSTQDVFKFLEEAVRRSQSYRGKILSLEKEDDYSGTSTGIQVHKLRTVAREQVILPSSTVELLDRNIIQFAQRRRQLAAFGLSTKKGVLLYGPPGTGKTHTIHYLAGAKGHTTLLITAEQVGLLSEYMTLARLLQPSIVVIEDADLIARDRASMESACEEVLLNKLLNEMDGLRPETDVFFILTTNRPEALESALASRPGRIDQAIEFPLPDDEGRQKLVRLYGKGLSVPSDVEEMAVRRTEGVSASFIKELMRRSAQFQLERDGEGSLSTDDLDQALNELLFAGGALNCRLLGVQSSRS